MIFKAVLLAFCLAQSSALEVHTQAGRLNAPTAPGNQPAHVKQKSKKKVDLADVIVQAVELMDAGILQFLTEESSTELPAVEKNPDDFAKIMKSQHKAMQVVRQMSSNFVALKDVAKKLKKHGASALAKENNQLKEERSNLKAAIHQLDARAQSCGDSLNNARAVVKSLKSASSNCSARISDEAAREVGQKAVADVKKIRKAEDDLESTQANMDVLRKENQDLKASIKDYEKRIAAFEGGGSKTSVMGQEVQECKKEKKSLQEDKDGLVKTVQHLLKANGTESLSQTLQKEVASLQKAQLETQRVYGKKVESLRDQLKTAQDNAQDVKEVAQAMNEQNAELTKKNDKLESKLQSCEADRKDLEDDKKALVSSLQGTLRQNTEYQAQMAKEEIKRADSPKKKQPAPKKSQTAGNVLKGPGTSKDDEIKVMGDMRAMDHYIASATVEQPAQEIVSMPVPEEKEPPAPAKPAPKWSQGIIPAKAAERNKLAKYLNQPIAEKELTPEEKEQEKERQEAKKEIDDDNNIGNDVGKLLSQAEDAVDNTQIDDDEAPTDEDVSDAQTLSDAAVLLQKSG